MPSRAFNLARLNPPTSGFTFPPMHRACANTRIRCTRAETTVLRLQLYVHQRPAVMNQQFTVIYAERIAPHVKDEDTHLYQSETKYFEVNKILKNNF